MSTAPFNVGAGKSAPEAFVQHCYLNRHAYAADLLDICAALALDDAILVGHSAGAMSCMLAAIQRPARFSRRILIGTSPRHLDAPDYRGGFSKADLDAIYRAIPGHFAAWADAFAPHFIAGPAG